MLASFLCLHNSVAKAPGRRALGLGRRHLQSRARGSGGDPGRGLNHRVCPRHTLCGFRFLVPQSRAGERFPSSSSGPLP